MISFKERTPIPSLCPFKESYIGETKRNVEIPSKEHRDIRKLAYAINVMKWNTQLHPNDFSVIIYTLGAVVWRQFWNKRQF